MAKGSPRCSCPLARGHPLLCPYSPSPQLPSLLLPVECLHWLRSSQLYVFILDAWYAGPVAGCGQAGDEMGLNETS